jgi:hypothetical protein
MAFGWPGGGPGLGTLSPCPGTENPPVVPADADLPRDGPCSGAPGQAGSLTGRHDHDHLPAFHLGELLDLPMNRLIDRILTS